MRARSIAIWVASMFGLASMLVSAIAGISLYCFEARELRRHKMEELEGRFVIVERLARHNEQASNWPKLTEKLTDFTPRDGSLRFLIDSRDARFRFGGDFLDHAQMTGPENGFGHAELAGQEFITRARDIPAMGERPPIRLILAISWQEVAQAQSALAIGILSISLLMVALASALGWWIARRGLAPVGRLSEHARYLGSGDMARRLPAEALPRELEGLVLTLNGALDRLQQSYIQLSTFNSDVAHELRTPLTNLIGETQVALARPRSAADFQTVLQSNLEELERLRDIVNDMLFLARADQGDLADNLVETSLADECRKTAEFMEVLFEEAGSELRIAGDARVCVERSLFGRAIANLLDNAVRHGQAGGTVLLTIAERAEDVSVTVFNPSAPIDPEKLPHIFDRFFRVDAARTNSSESHGLGLAIVRAIAKMHGGTVFARNGERGVYIGFTIARGHKDTAPATSPDRRGVGPP